MNMAKRKVISNSTCKSSIVREERDKREGQQNRKEWDSVYRLKEERAPYDR